MVILMVSKFDGISHPFNLFMAVMHSYTLCLITAVPPHQSFATPVPGPQAFKIYTPVTVPQAAKTLHVTIPVFFK